MGTSDDLLVNNDANKREICEDVSVKSYYAFKHCTQEIITVAKLDTFYVLAILKSSCQVCSYFDEVSATCMLSKLCSSYVQHVPKYKKIFGQKYFLRRNYRHYRNLPEVHQVPAVNQTRRNALGERELEILEMYPHGSRTELGLLWTRHQVDRELLAFLKLIAQADLQTLS